MKRTITIVFTACMFSMVSAQEVEGNMKQDSSTFCFIIKDGLPVIMSEGKQVYNEVTLQNGTVIKTDGTVIKHSGEMMTLRQNECIDFRGDLVRIAQKPVKSAKAGKK
jgi:hypothetical protein